MQNKKKVKVRWYDDRGNRTLIIGALFILVPDATLRCLGFFFLGIAFREKMLE